MHTGKGQVLELILDNGYRYVRVSCLPNLIPAPGQYLLANDRRDSPLPVPLFYTDLAPQGFIANAPDTAAWTPGLEIFLRGPLGRGFTVPLSARKIGLVAFDGSPARLRGLIRPALRQGAAVVLVCDAASEDLPDDVEVQPLSALNEVLPWVDYVAFDAAREAMPLLREHLGAQRQRLAGVGAQVLVRTPVPCGGIAECGICAVTTKPDWKLACKDGPVFDWRELD
jgi:NAD(P)H-flavin reductase